MASVFGDADSDPLNVTASTSDYNIAEAIIFQDTLTVIAVSKRVGDHHGNGPGR